jgi:hypothetical protein
MSVEQDTLSGISMPVNTFYVSLLVPVETPRHSGTEPEQGRLSWLLVSKRQIVQIDVIGILPAIAVHLIVDG